MSTRTQKFVSCPSATWKLTDTCLHRTSTVSRHTLKHNQNFRIFLAKSHLNDKCNSFASNKIFKAASSPSELKWDRWGSTLLSIRPIIQHQLFLSTSSLRRMLSIKHASAKLTDTGNRHVCCSVSLQKGSFYTCP